MKRKFMAVLLCAVLSAATLCLSSGCKEKKQPLILYLGDSIAEALIGPSPLSERENYGYYGIVGQTNGYKYVNRSVSGDRAIRMYEYIVLPDDGATMTQTHIKNADIIHISMIGNDVLNPTDMGPTVISAFDGDLTDLNRRITFAKEYIYKIGDYIKELNPDATVFFVKIYNPLFYGSPLLSKASQAELESRGITEKVFREKTDELLTMANKVLDDYVAEKGGNTYTLETGEAFREIFDSDTEKGKKLIFGDGVHPSNEGHAVIYDVTQKKLVELGLAEDNSALRKYRTLRIDQLKRLYGDSVDVQEIRRAINRAKTVAEVSEVYFRAIEGKTPLYC